MAMMNVQDTVLQELSEGELDAQLIRILQQVDRSTTLADNTLLLLHTAHEMARRTTHTNITANSVHATMCELLAELHADSVEQDREQRAHYLQILLTCVCDGCFGAAETVDVDATERGETNGE